MRVEIVSKNYKVSDHLREIIEKKTAKFDRYFDDDAVAKYSLKQIGKDYVMEVTMYYNGSIVRSEVKSDNMYSNIDIALPKVEGQIRKLRTKFDKTRKSASIDDAVIYESVLPPVKELVRTKTFRLREIAVKDAIEEMERIDHDFFAFLNEANGMVNIVYRRLDGTVGLLDLTY